MGGSEVKHGHTGSGDQVNNTGDGTVNMINGNGSTYNASTINIGEHDETVPSPKSKVNPDNLKPSWP
jgi:hypothetical protein